MCPTPITILNANISRIKLIIKIDFILIKAHALNNHGWVNYLHIKKERKNVYKANINFKFKKINKKSNQYKLLSKIKTP